VSDALHFSVTHDEILRQIVTCNDDYKFITYPHSILQEFVVDDGVMNTFPLRGSLQELEKVASFVDPFL